MALQAPAESKRYFEDELIEGDQRIVSLASPTEYLLRRPFENSLPLPPEEIVGDSALPAQVSPPSAGTKNQHTQRPLQPPRDLRFASPFGAHKMSLLAW